MQADADELPQVGRTARSLGVRLNEDISPDENGRVNPGQGGMSVSPGSIWNVPSHRRPRGMARGSTGPANDRIYEVYEEAIVERRLLLRPDPKAPTRHAFVEPATQMPFEAYELELVSTRPAWRQVWPA